MVEAMLQAVDNQNIGYDQGERLDISKFTLRFYKDTIKGQKITSLLLL